MLSQIKRWLNILEPSLEIEKTVDPTNASPGDTVFYDIVFYHDGVSSATAYNVTITDVIPAYLSYIPGTWQLVSGPSYTIKDFASPQLSAYFPVVNQTYTQTNPIHLRYAAVISGLAPLGSLITNTATVQWTSLPEDTYGETLRWQRRGQ